MKRTIKQVIAIAAIAVAGNVYASGLNTFGGHVICGLGEGVGGVIKFVGNTTNKIIHPMLKVGGDASESTWRHIDNSTSKWVK